MLDVLDALVAELVNARQVEVDHSRHPHGSPARRTVYDRTMSDTPDDRVSPDEPVVPNEDAPPETEDDPPVE